MPPAGFAPAIPASEQPQTHVLHRAATEIGRRWGYVSEIQLIIVKYEYCHLLINKSYVLFLCVNRLIIYLDYTRLLHLMRSSFQRQ